MLFGTNDGKILEIFMKKPTEGFQVRDIIRLTRLGNPTVARGLERPREKGLIKKSKGRIFPYYEARLGSILFRGLKLAYNLAALDSLVRDIAGKARPNCIVLFGSGAKGEDTEKSDMDIFVQAKKRQDVDASKTEKRLNRKISMLFEPEVPKLSKELLNNLANGIVIFGFFEVVK